MTRLFSIFVVLLLFLSLSLSSLAYVDSDITPLCGQDYLTVAQDLIRNARQSIFLKMYLFSSRDSFGWGLAKELIEAHRHGVEVEVILDKSGEGDRKNEMTYNYLKEAGIRVRYDSDEVLTHSKILIVDNEMVIVGSQNWTMAGLSLNNEAGVFIKSKKISEGLLKGESVIDDKVMTLNENNYYTFLSRAFQEAGESIHILMYQLERCPGTLSLVQELVRARGRGVKIEIILDQSFRDNLPEGKNLSGVNLLKENGLEVKFDGVARLTHAKLVIIDGKKTFLGSQNWIDQSGIRYDEDSVAIRSDELARAFLQFMASLEISPSIFPEDEGGEGVKIPYNLLINEAVPTPAVELLDRRAERAFKLYLLLLQAGSEGSSALNISNEYEKMAKILGYDRSKAKGSAKYYRNYYRQHLFRLLRILEKVRLIRFEQCSGLVTFLDPGRTKGPYPIRDRYFVIPDKFWLYGWDKRLSHKAIYFYLIGLLEKSLYPEKAWWSRSYNGMAGLYRISPNTIWEALLELQRFNLMEVYREAWEPDESFADREKNRYFINRLYPMEDFEYKWGSLRERYGESLALEARSLAEELDEPYDLVVIESFIGLLRDYGLAKVKEANKITAAFRRSYGKRHFGYTRAILERSPVSSTQ